jgi:hypothetical protein
MSSRVARLVENFERHASIPWPSTLAGPQRIWFAVYDKNDERRVRARLGEFSLACERAGHGWAVVDLTDAFPEWLGGHEYRDAYFENPEALEVALDDFLAHTAGRVRQMLAAADANTVVALVGVGALFPFVKTSALVKQVQDDVPGRLLVFFPGTHENNVYRLLDARDGWIYMAVPITPDDGHTGP